MLDYSCRHELRWGYFSLNFVDRFVNFGQYSFEMSLPLDYFLNGEYLRTVDYLMNLYYIFDSYPLHLCLCLVAQSIAKSQVIVNSKCPFFGAGSCRSGRRPQDRLHLLRTFSLCLD